MLSKRVEERRNQLEVVSLDELVPEDHLADSYTHLTLPTMSIRWISGWGGGGEKGG
ncbi:hypothetical protein H8I08_18780, partial [Bacillus pumilus]|nr:hypothetical protein [Bacillus pumilus]